jgi:predicted GIY-YIG superfamily endonuclease
MTYVYLIESVNTPTKRYIGKSNNLKIRLADHNAGRSVFTSVARPWRLVAYHAFSDQHKATAFEHYLKSGSGRAFARRRLW